MSITICKCSACRMRMNCFSSLLYTLDTTRQILAAAYHFFVTLLFLVPSCSMCLRVYVHCEWSSRSAVCMDMRSKMCRHDEWLSMQSHDTHLHVFHDDEFIFFGNASQSCVLLTYIDMTWIHRLCVKYLLVTLHQVLNYGSTWRGIVLLQPLSSCAYFTWSV